MTDQELAGYVASISAVIRTWAKSPLQRQEVVSMLCSLDIAEEDAEAVLEDGLARGALREDEEGIRAIDRRDCWHSDLAALR